MKVRTLKNHLFAGHNRRVGDEYKATSADLRLLKAFGWAEEIKDAPVYHTRVMVAESALHPQIEAMTQFFSALSGPAVQEVLPKQKRKYTRKAKTE